ncbi:MAG: hypothetical protein IJZ98_04925 [Bacteroidales bacterium]|nr:hypothetical protein [Bacteroidales bacterium]
MKILKYISFAFPLMSVGCKGYIGGIDDADIKFSQIVMVNRSSHEIRVNVSNSKVVSPQDTIYLEPKNGLWKKTKEGQHFDFSLNDGIMTLTFEDGRKVCFDSVFPYEIENPVNLNDSKGLYNVYEFTDEYCEEIFRHHDQLNTFRLISLPPSMVRDSVVEEGSTEGWFLNIYPVPAVREKLEIGRIVRNEAESLENIVFESGKVPCTVNKEEITYIPPSKSRTGYYSSEDLRKIGMAHFGCDFAQLTGKSQEMEKFAGVITYNITYDYKEELEYTDQTQEFASQMEEGTVAIQHIQYGRLMFLLAEADCNPSYLGSSIERAMRQNDSDKELWVEDIDFHLITLNKEGEFQCQSGGRELLDLFINGMDNQPVHPLYFNLTDFGIGDDVLHIQNIK